MKEFKTGDRVEITCEGEYAGMSGKIISGPPGALAVLLDTERHIFWCWHEEHLKPFEPKVGDRVLIRGRGDYADSEGYITHHEHPYYRILVKGPSSLLLRKADFQVYGRGRQDAVKRKSQADPGPRNAVFIENAERGDEVVFENNDTVYVFQGKASCGPDRHHFKPKNVHTGFTLPTSLFSSLHIVSWTRPKEQTRYKVKVSTPMFNNNWFDADNLEDLAKQVKSKFPTVLDFEVLKSGKPDPRYPTAKNQILEEE